MLEMFQWSNKDVPVAVNNSNTIGKGRFSTLFRRHLQEEATAKSHLSRLGFKAKVAGDKCSGRALIESFGVTNPEGRRQDCEFQRSGTNFLFTASGTKTNHGMFRGSKDRQEWLAPMGFGLSPFICPTACLQVMEHSQSPPK